MIGEFAISLAGHDKGQMYLIVGEEADMVCLVDGKIRKLENPKKKKKKHVQTVKRNIDISLAERLKNKQKIYDEEIKSAIKIRKNEEVTHV